MPILDSDTSHGLGGQYKTFRQISRDRLLYEMLQDSKSADSKSSWKVLIMDKVTLKVMSHSCKMADITVQGVSLVDDLFRRREPMPSMDVIYFIQPTKENVVMFLSDMSGREPLYRKAHIYFSSKVSKDLITRIKNDTSVLPRIGALREMNLEYFSIDHQGFITDHENALQELFGHNAANSRRFDTCLYEMATRIATVFASLKEFPFVHYKVSKGLEDTTEMTHCDLIPSKLAAAVWDRVTTYRSSIPNFPQTETCELLIVDRSVDQIAPVIHEWTYDAMCHDLLEMDGNKYVHGVPSISGGERKRKEVLLEEHDPIWLELQHARFAEASERLHDKMLKFVSQNKATKLQQRNGGELSMRDPLKIVQALPQYNEQMEKLTLHVQIAGKLNQIIRDVGLRELGQLEQDLVYGDAGAKEVIKYLIANKETLSENKLRLLLIYACAYPDKFEGDNGIKLMQLAKLSQADMKAVKSMKMLKGSLPKETSSHASFLHKFDSTKKKHPEPKDRVGEEETWALFRFCPKIEELIRKLSKGELPNDEYHCMNKPSSSSQAAYGSNGSPQQNSPVRPGQSTTIADSKILANTTYDQGFYSKEDFTKLVSRQTAQWAQSWTSDDEASRGSLLTSEFAGLKGVGQRIFVFIIGGATRSELRVCHKLTAKLRREVILGTTSFDDPPQYITKLKLLSEQELSVEDIKFR